MKKKLLVLTSILLMLICFAIPVSAADATSNVNSRTAHRGDTVTFEAKLSSGIEVGSGSVELSYDSTVLKLESGKWNVSDTILTNFDSKNEKGAFAYLTSAEISGTIFTATFKVLDTAAFGTTEVSMKVGLKDGSNVDLDVSNNSGSITVECYHDFSLRDTSDKYLKSSANCKSPAIYYYGCTVCGAKGTTTFVYGTTLPHVYDQTITTKTYLKSAATCTEKAVYYYSCTCGAKGTETFEYGNVLKHTFNQQNTSAKYLKSAADCENAAVYYKSCSCGEKGTETFIYGSKLNHTGGVATCTSKAICSRCEKEYGDLKNHIYDQEKVTEEYLESGATCTKKAIYYKSCICGAKGTTTFVYGTTLPHVYDQTVTTKTYLKSAATCTEKAVYYYSCTCGAKGTDTFAIGDEPSHSYNTVWSSNAKEHWHECSKCEDKKDIAAHTPGAQATEYTAQICTVCEYVMTPAFGHTHNYATEWMSDAETHWHECVCGNKVDNSAHAWDAGVDTKQATNAENGVKKYTCTVCGLEKSESIDKLVDSDETGKTTDEIKKGCGSTVTSGFMFLAVFTMAWIIKKKEKNDV